jgi:hypothetical protein
VLSNKARYGLRDHCLFLYFREKLDALAGNRASDQFVSETDPSTYLAEISRGYTFREMRCDETAVPSAYCSLMHFGALLMATDSMRPQQIMAHVRQIQAACSLSDSNALSMNPALQLAAFLMIALPGQRPYVAFVVSPSLIPFARRLAQLLGGSLAHGSAGLIPFIWPLPAQRMANNATRFLPCSAIKATTKSKS